ncbi:hypothetical protein GCM10017687_16630 [Streptomyces echinatus]
MEVRWAGVRAPLKTSATTRSRPAVRHLGQARAGVHRAHPDPRARVQRQLAADQLDQARVPFHDLLGGAGPGRGDVPGEGERAAAEVHGVHGLAGRGRRGR